MDAPPSSTLLRAAFRTRRRPFVIASAAAFVCALCLLAIPLLSGWALDGIVAGRPPRTLLPALVGLAVVGVVRALAAGVRKWYSFKFQTLVGVDLRDGLYRHCQRLSFAYHDRLGPGELMSRVAGDVSMVESTVGILPFVGQSMLVGVFGAVVLFLVHPVLAAAVVGSVAALSVLSVRHARVLYPPSRAVQDRLGAFGQFVEQQANGIRVIKGHGFEAPSLARGAALAAEARDAGVDLAVRRARVMNTFVVGPFLAILLVLGGGVWLGARGHMTTGDLFAFLQYIALLIAPVAIGAHLMTVWPQAVGSAGRVAEVLEATPDVADPAYPVPLPDGPGEIRFEGVWFGYHPSRPVLQGLDLVVEGGTSVALVGISGAGKTTLAYLVPRFYDAWAGTVSIDGTPVSAASLAALRRTVSIVFEDTVVFTDTIRRNITMARPDASDEDVSDAARRAHAAAFIEALPDGYDTVVGEQGASLSGGQRQRLAIARAILARPQVLILDDAMSAVDPSTDAAIRLGLREVLRGRTALIIAHRVETLELADRVVLLEGGVVVADGTHAELVSVPAYRAALALDEEVSA
jgi:ATP-binding cassette subfamily B protein